MAIIEILRIYNHILFFQHCLKSDNNLSDSQISGGMHRVQYRDVIGQSRIRGHPINIICTRTKFHKMMSITKSLKAEI